MPSLSTPSRAPTPRAPESAVASTEGGSPEWMSRYNLSAGNSATLALIAPGASSDEASASALLEGEDAGVTSAGPSAAEDTSEDGGPATPSHAPSGTLGKVYRKHERQTDAMKLKLSASQKNELQIFQDNWAQNHARYEAVSAKTGVPAKLIAAIHYRESSLDWNTYLHQGDPLGKKAKHHPSNIPVFYKWEDAAVHALNLKSSVRDGMGMDATTTDPEALATYAEAYNGLGYDQRGKASPYVYGGTDQYKGGRYVADGVYDSRSWDQRLGVMALVGGLDGAEVGQAEPTPQREDVAWTLVREGKDVLKLGVSGAGVRALQQKLAGHGLRVSVDGSFGAGTANAVRSFQQKRGVTADGVVGAGTAALIDGEQAPEAPAADTTNPEWARVLAGGLLMTRGDEGDHVRIVQEALVRHGFPCGVDGSFGRATERAVEAFQRKHRLDADGVVGRTTARALEA